MANPLPGATAGSTPPGALFGPSLDRFFRIHEKVLWQFGALDFGAIRTDLLTQHDLAGVRVAMLVESHTPVYTQLLLELFRHDHEVTAFLAIWAYEEMKHYAALRTYLEASSMVDLGALDRELAVTRAGPLPEKEACFSRVQSFTYTMLQEQVTGWFYKRFAGGVREPLLKTILQLIAKDEYRHCQYYLEKARQELDGNRRLLEEVDQVLLEFQMPGPSFVPEYARHYAAGRLVAPPDRSAVQETLQKVSQLTGKLHLMKLATSRAFQRKLWEEFGLDIRLGLNGLR